MSGMVAAARMAPGNTRRNISLVPNSNGSFIGV
jgi:hypothetical protein